jgi:DNA-directed RNA polymerase I subunit RPA2
MPSEGERLEKGMPVCCFVDTLTGECRAVKFKDAEGAFVETVRVLGQQGNSGASVSMGMLGSGSGLCRRVSITFRYPRRPIIGDKFSSRHGQKGTLSVLWPQENMPFSECGMSPDVLINPHAFPSRMTIGMLVESMAGKAGALHGHYQDATPFSFHEGERVIDHMGEQLRAAGFHYYGSEPLYSGLSGELMHCDIFMGVVYYQRLRHMVADKSQVRATGAVVATTRQPVKGRKKHGGIRLGEMERDALLSHGAAFCVHDRLMKCSDSHIAYCCANCGGLLTVRALGPLAAQAKAKRSSLGAAAAGGSPASSSSAGAGAWAGAGSAVHGGAARLGQGNIRSVNFCSACESAEWVRPIHLPYVFRFLLNELAGMGIKVSLSLR